MKSVTPEFVKNEFELLGREIDELSEFVISIEKLLTNKPEER